jgi:flagellar L-ring protein precursor FlgH
MKSTIFLLFVTLGCFAADKKKPVEQPQNSPLDKYVSEAKARFAEAPAAGLGGIWAPGSRLADSTRDMRASQVDDVITIVVVENASAVVSGGTSTERASSTANSIGALAGLTKVGGLWNNLAATSGDTKLKGSGTTSRNMVISTTMTARVSAVLPNGVMLVEASKDVEINTERQTITVRGIVRPADVSSANTVTSNLLGQLEVRVNGKGVINDAIRRPNFLYRFLLGILPF